MKKIDSNCFKGKYIYKVRLTKKRKNTLYSSKKNVLTIKKLSKGNYTVTYRVMKQKKKGVFTPVTNWSNKVKFVIK